MNIEQVLERTGLTDAEIARRLDITPQAVRGWRKTGRISKESVLRLSALANVSPDALLSTEPARLFDIKTDLDPLVDGDVQIDVPEIELSAGSGASAYAFTETPYKHTYRAEFLRAKGVRPGAAKRCKVRGDSMERVLFDGDLVTINMDDCRIVDDAVYAIVVADQLRVKRLRRRRDGGLLIVSENERYAVEEVPVSELDSVHVIGRVFDRSGGGGL